MSNPSRLAFLLLGSTLALGFFLGSDRIAHAVALRRAQPETMVRGVATQQVKSDLGLMTIQLSRRGVGLDGLTAALNTRREALLKDLALRGFGPGDLTVEAMDYNVYEPAPAGTKEINPERHARGAEREFGVYQTIRIRTAKVRELLGYSRTTVDFAGEVQMGRSRPEFRVSSLDDSKRELLEAATKDARRRAEILVAGSGSQIGNLLEASQGVFEVLSLENPRSGGYDTYDTTSIDKLVRVVVTLRYEIVRE